MSTPVPSPADRPQPEITFGDVIRAGRKKLKEMRTVFLLLSLIAVAALICAIVPQNGDLQSYSTRYGRFIGRVIVRLGLDHVHMTMWFQLLIAVLLLSLMACSGRLWKEATLRWRIPTAAEASSKLRAGGELSGLVPLAPEQAISAVTPALRKHGYRLHHLEAEGELRLLYVHKRRLSAWGQALVHYAVFLIALGSVMGAIPRLSVDQRVTIMEGDSFRSEDGTIPFAITVDRFTIARDPDSGSVENYYSEVRILSASQEVQRGTISVNRTMRYKGYLISQSDWGLGEAKIEITRSGKSQQHAFPLERGPGIGDDRSMWSVPQKSSALFLPGSHGALVATRFCPDAVRRNGRLYQRSSEYPGTPALSLAYVSGVSGPKPTGGAQRPPTPWVRELGWLLPGEALSLNDGWIRFIGITKYTGLGIRKDVGLPLVWGGFIACIIGLTMIFYFPLRRCVIGFEPRGQGRTALTLSLCGHAGDPADDTNRIWNDMLERSGGKPVAGAATEPDQEESTSA
ncbi:MAG: cytochrome c biogenesis protein ResB [Armatimonadia bacterium]